MMKPSRETPSPDSAILHLPAPSCRESTCLPATCRPFSPPTRPSCARKRADTQGTSRDTTACGPLGPQAPLQQDLMRKLEHADILCHRAAGVGLVLPGEQTPLDVPGGNERKEVDGPRSRLAAGPVKTHEHRRKELTGAQIQADHAPARASQATAWPFLNALDLRTKEARHTVNVKERITWRELTKRLAATRTRNELHNKLLCFSPKTTVHRYTLPRSQPRRHSSESIGTYPMSRWHRGKESQP